jgi:hypothetical protein
MVSQKWVLLPDVFKRMSTQLPYKHIRRCNLITTQIRVKTASRTSH